MSTRVLGLVPWVAVACLSVSQAMAQVEPGLPPPAPGTPGVITVSHPYGQYGHVGNTVSGNVPPGPAPDGWLNWCAPTATANSFIYLQNHYPGVYDNLLINGANPQNPVGLRDTLANGWVNKAGVQRGGMNPGGQQAGTSDKDWWEMKCYYIEDFAPGTTILKGMIEYAPVDPVTGPWHNANLLTLGSPTWDWLWLQIASCEDVEIKIDTGSSLAHALTLSSMTFQDNVIVNGKWDPGELRWMDYIDPNNPNQLLWGQVANNLAGNRLQLWWNNLGYNPAQWVTIEMSFAESPVPLPSSIWMAMALLLALASWRIVHRRHAAA